MKVKVQIEGYTCLFGDPSKGLIVLSNTAVDRQVSVPCDAQMLRQLKTRLKDNKDTYDCLPEVMGRVLLRDAMSQYEIIIDRVNDDKTYGAVIVNESSFEMDRIDAVDGILLSVSSTFPLYVEGSLWKRQSSPYSPEDSKRGILGLPINIFTDDMLPNALDQAVEREDYIAAGYIRDEIQRRKNLKSKASGKDAACPKK